MNNHSILITKPEKDYELLDSGDNEKLERYGAVVLSRPDPQAMWPKKLSQKEWEKADAFFTREDKKANWSFRTKIDERWQIDFGGLKFIIKPSAFKHTGLFPEQLQNWNWLKDIIGKQKTEVKVLNLFGYTGGASLAMAQSGAQVTHIDASKSAIGWGRENATISGLADKPIRWILEDAMSFVDKEIKRGKTYEGIILDPPAFGHGPTGEMWKIEEDLTTLILKCKKIMSDKPLFFLINGYASGYSAIAYENNLRSVFGNTGKYESGELTIEESGKNPRLLPCGIFSRWQRENF